MKTRVLIGMFLIIGMVSATSIFASEIIGSFPAKTNMIARMDLDKLRANSIFSRCKERNLEKYNSACEKFCAESGVNPDDIRTVWFAGIRKDRGIVVLEGNFNAEKIREAVSKKPEVEIQARTDAELALLFPDRRQENGKNLAALINRSTIVFGSPDITDEFIRNYASRQPAQDFGRKGVISGDRLFEGTVIAVPQDVAAERPFLAEVDSGRFILDLNGKIEIILMLQMTGAEQADAIRKIIEGMVAFGKMSRNGQEQESPLKKEFFDNMAIENNGNSVTVKTWLSENGVNSEIDRKAGSAGGRHSR